MQIIEMRAIILYLKNFIAQIPSQPERNLQHCMFLKISFYHETTKVRLLLI